MRTSSTTASWPTMTLPSSDLIFSAEALRPWTAFRSASAGSVACGAGAVVLMVLKIGSDVCSWARQRGRLISKAARGKPNKTHVSHRPGRILTAPDFSLSPRRRSVERGESPHPTALLSPALSSLRMCLAWRTLAPPLNTYPPSEGGEESAGSGSRSARLRPPDSTARAPACRGHAPPVNWLLR